MLHRDLKTQNVLISRSFGARVSDLGESREYYAGIDDLTIVGTPYFVAPEVLAGERYAQPADVFSYAVILAQVRASRVSAAVRAGGARRCPRRPSL